MNQQLPTMYTIGESELVESIGFGKPENGYGTLFVRLKEKGVYSFERVPEILFHEFLQAPSKGKYFVNEVKGKYREQKVA